MTKGYMRFPEGKSKALTLSYDDGVEQDIKLLGIMNQYGLKGTFNLNSGLYAEEGTCYPPQQIHRRMSKSQVLNCFRNSGQEIAIHSLTHPSLAELPKDQVKFEIMEDKKNLEKQFETNVRGMAYPYGTFDDQVVSTLIDCNIAYSRTVISTMDFQIPKDWLRLTATCHHNAPELMELSKKFLEDTIQKEPYLFYLWGHSYEFEENDNWDIIEKFASYISKNQDVWYATNIQLFDYINAYESLIFNKEGNMIKNPSHMDIWVQIGTKKMEIKAGMTIEIPGI